MATRRITTALTTPVIAAGLFLGGLGIAATAQAQSAGTAATECSTIAVPAIRSNTNSLNPLTRAAQVTESQPGLQGPPVRNAC